MVVTPHDPAARFWPWTEEDPPGDAPWSCWRQRFAQVGAALDPPAPLRDAVALLAAWRACWRLEPLLPPLDATDLPAQSPLWRAAFASPPLRRGLLRALAGRPDEPPRLMEVRALLSQPDARAHLSAVFLRHLDDTRPGMPDRGSEASALSDALLAGLEACWRFVSGQAAFLHLALPLRAWRGWALEASARDADFARDYLAEDPLFRRAWEHQRWGLADDPAPLVGHHYVRGFLLQALHDAGEDQVPGARALLDALPAAPLRYYEAEGRLWERLPPDADSLGLFLQLAAAFGASEEKARAWLAPLRPSLRDGVIPTWLYQGPDGPTTAEPRWEWGGDDCDAVRLVLLAGLVDWEPSAWADVIAQNTAAVLGRAEAGALSVFYYPESYAWLLLGRLSARWSAAGERIPDELAPLGARLEASCRARAAALEASQRLDGGWGPAGAPASTQDTACALSLLARFGGDRLSLERGLRSLSEHQRPDGSWAGEGFFVTSGKAPAALRYHQAAELTTALCLRALREALSAAETLREETP